MWTEVAKFVEGAQRAAGPDALRAAFASAVRALGFDAFGYAGMYAPFGAETPPYMVSTFPQSWQDRYIEHQHHRDDPVIAEAIRSVIPFRWDELSQRRPLRGEEVAVLVAAREHGLVHGFTVPVHGLGGELGMTTVVSSQPSSREFDRLVEEHRHTLHLMGVHLHNALRERAAAMPTREARLSPREIECIAWTAQGKTTWEVSQILRLSEATVNFYLRNAMRKLGVHSKAHAVAKTLVLGLIHP